MNYSHIKFTTPAIAWALLMLFVGFFTARFYLPPFNYKSRIWKTSLKINVEDKIYNAISISSGTIIAVYMLITLSNFTFPFKLFGIPLLPFVICLFTPYLLIVITNLLLALVFPDPTENKKETKEHRKSFEKLYEREAVVIRLQNYEEYWGHVSFRMDGVYAAEANKPETLLKAYSKPLTSESELNNVTEDFIRYVKEGGFDTDQSTEKRIV